MIRIMGTWILGCENRYERGEQEFWLIEKGDSIITVGFRYRIFIWIGYYWILFEQPIQQVTVELKKTI